MNYKAEFHRVLTRIERGNFSPRFYLASYVILVGLFSFLVSR